jgi:hypothetical protein
MTPLIDISTEESGRKRLFKDSPTACFGRKYTEGDGPCNGDAKKHARPCKHLMRCKKCWLARKNAGITDPNDYTIEDDWESLPDIPDTEDGDHAIPAATTIDHAALADVEERLGKIETEAVGATLSYYIQLGAEYSLVQRQMTYKDFRKWLELRDRKYDAVARYCRTYSLVLSLGDTAKNKILAAPGMSFLKLVTIINEAGPEKLLPLLDRQVQVEGKDVPLTSLGYREISKTLRADARQEKVNAQVAAMVEKAEATDAAREAIANAGALPPPEDESTHYEENGGFDPDAEKQRSPTDAVPFHPAPCLLPMINLSRLWGKQRAKIGIGNVVALRAKDAQMLRGVLQFLTDVLVPDLAKILNDQGQGKA